MGDEKPAVVMANRETDRELLIPVADSGDKDDGPSSKPSSSASSSSSSSSSSSHQSSHETLSLFIRGWASKKFMTGCVILLPIAITFYITWWFIHFVDGFFSPIYAQIGINVFGFGFLTSIAFIFLVGVFMSSWLGASVLNLGEWFIKRMPFVCHIYNASKQISTAISPDQNTQAFKEVAIIRHPRIGEYAFGFITSTVVLQIHEEQSPAAINYDDCGSRSGTVLGGRDEEELYLSLVIDESTLRSKNLSIYESIVIYLYFSCSIEIYVLLCLPFEKTVGTND